MSLTTSLETRLAMFRAMMESLSITESSSLIVEIMLNGLPLHPGVWPDYAPKTLRPGEWSLSESTLVIPPIDCGTYLGQSKRIQIQARIRATDSAEHMDVDIDPIVVATGQNLTVHVSIGAPGQGP